MSMALKLKQRAGPQVRVRGASSRASASADEIVGLFLKATNKRIADPFEVARSLVEAGASVRSVKGAVEQLAAGRQAFVTISAGADRRLLGRRLRDQAIVPRLVEASLDLDVKALRERLGISQESFAARYALDLASVRNWEQGRTRPDGAAIALLNLIQRAPEQVAELLSSEI